MRITNNKGFSLVELMVVVAIIGILATMSVGAIQKQVAKTRQSEAKTNLANLFTAEKGFHSEFGTYTASFGVMKLAYEGSMRYNTGFAAAGANDTLAGLQSFGYPGTVLPTAYYNTQQFCAVAANGCRNTANVPAAIGNPGNGGSVGVAPAPVQPSATVFTAISTSSNLYKNNGDGWRITETKNLQNTLDPLGGAN